MMHWSLAGSSLAAAEDGLVAENAAWVAVLGFGQTQGSAH